MAQKKPRRFDDSRFFIGTRKVTSHGVAKRTRAPKTQPPTRSGQLRPTRKKALHRFVLEISSPALKDWDAKGEGVFGAAACDLRKRPQVIISNRF